MENLITKIKHIIIGNFNNILYKKSKLEQDRLEKCINFSHTIFNNKVCEICYCIIDAKVTIDEEKCPIKKW